MTLKEIAHAFNMSVDDFAKCIGYTRQSLYDKTSVKKTFRAKAAISLLRFLNDSMLQQEMEQLNKRLYCRKQAIEELKRLLLDGETKMDGGNEDV